MVKLRELRQEKNITQKELSEAISVSRSQITKWEIGMLEPNIEMLNKLADYFDVSIDYLVGRKDY